MVQKGTGFFMPRSPDDIAREKGGLDAPSRAADLPETCRDAAQPQVGNSTCAKSRRCGRTSSTQHRSPAAAKEPVGRSSSASAPCAFTEGRGASLGLRAASWTSPTDRHSPGHQRSACACSDQLFSSANSQDRHTAAEADVPRVQSPPAAALDLGCWGQVVPVLRVGGSSSFAGSSPNSSGLLPVVSPQSSCLVAAPARCDSYHLFSTSLALNTYTGGQDSAAGLQDVLIPLGGTLMPAATTTTTTATAAALQSPVPGQQQQAGWGSAADLNALLQLQLSLVAADPAAAAAPAAPASAGPVEVYSSASCLADSSSLLGLYSGGLSAPLLPVLDSSSLNALQQEHRLPDGLMAPGLTLPIHSTAAQAQLSALGPEHDSMSLCGGGPQPPASSSLVAALNGSSSAGSPHTRQRVVGNDVAAVAAAVAQDKLAQIQQLEMLQQQLRNEVANLLALI